MEGNFAGKRAEYGLSDEVLQHFYRSLLVKASFEIWDYLGVSGNLSDVTGVIPKTGFIMWLDDKENVFCFGDVFLCRYQGIEFVCHVIGELSIPSSADFWKIKWFNLIIWLGDDLKEQEVDLGELCESCFDSQPICTPLSSKANLYPVRLY